MKRERDSQRSKLYKAEGVLGKYSKRLETVPQIERYVKKVSEKATIQRRYKRFLTRNIIVRDGRGRLSAGGDYSGIWMPVWSRTEYLVLHELSHTLTQRKYGQKVAGHGWQYAAIYLDLVRFALGVEAFESLKESFKKHKVRFSEKKTRQITDEQRKVLIERMAKAREAKGKKAA